MNQILHGDCLELMPHIPDKSVDCILTDLPYGTTACHWDSVIPFEPLWTQYKRIIKDRGAIVLTASQPFTSALVMSNIKWFKYEWIWDKVRPTGYLDAKLRPMKRHEDIVVFGFGGVSNGSRIPMKYNPAGVKKLDKPRVRPDKFVTATNRSAIHGKGKQTHSGYPHSIVVVSKESETVHPTQKPVALFEYLIKTYTNDRELVLDNCAGSFTTAIACLNTDRKYICMEKDEGYFRVGKERIAKWHKEQGLFKEQQ